jgi:FlgD Ig-like domain/Right handed beta helix region
MNRVRRCCRHLLPVCLLFALAAVLPAWATDVGGHITTDTTWSVAGSPYVVTSNLVVDAGVTLTIDPGVAVRFQPGLYMQVGGTLTAIGAADNPITFTSNAGAPAAGDWDALRFEDDAGSSSVLRYCRVRYAGGAGHGAIYVADTYGSANITIRDTLITNSGGVGILCHNTRPTIQGCTIQNCATYAIYLEPSASPLYPAPNTFEGNGTNAVGIGGTTWSTATWRRAGPYPLVVPQDVVVANGSTLTIKPRTTVKLAAGVGIRSDGALKAIGGSTPGRHITFTGTAGSPSPGAWDSVKLYGPGSTDSVLEYCDFLFGGGGGSGALICDGTPTKTSPTVSYCTISDSSSQGIYCKNAAPAIGACTIRRCAARPIHLAPTSGPTYPDPNTYVDNAIQTVGVDGGSWSTATWRKPGLPYEVLADVTIAYGHSLTILQGVTVRLHQNTGIEVGGILVAAGTPTAPITFTSWVTGTPHKGDWEHISFYGPDSSASQLVSCNIRYGGKAGASLVAMVLCQGSNGGGAPTFRDCTVEKSAGDGVSLNTGASPTLENLSILNNDGSGVHVDASTSIIVGCRVTGNKVGVLVHSYGVPRLGNVGNASTLDDGDNVFAGNADYDVVNYLADPIKAENNHWVSDDPDVIAQHIWDHSDNAELGVVDFRPYQGPAVLVLPLGSPRIAGLAAQANGLGGGTMTFALSAPATVEASVVNMAGRLVKRVCTGRAMDAGSQTLAWDGGTETGTRAPRGSYLVRLTARGADGSQAQALALLRLTR